MVSGIKKLAKYFLDNNIYYLDDKLNEIIKNRRKKNFALLINQASFFEHNNKFIFTLDFIKEFFNLKRVFAPQHGLFPITQANMITWENYYDKIHNIEVISLYSKNGLKPDIKYLEDIDYILIDIQDIGVRYYTYIWSLIYLIEQVQKLKKEIIIFNRLNPLGKAKEGVILEEEYFSFVGMAKIHNRHGLTIKDIINLKFNDKNFINIIDFTKKEETIYKEKLDYYFIPTSPNINSIKTIYFYIGFCLLEGTNISEGRGTTYPFSAFGAPFINETKLKKRIDYYKEKYNIQGVEFIYHSFKPTFDKYKDEICRGLKMIITDKNKFKSLKTACIVLKAINDLYPNDFKFLDPPYEYEYIKKPIDILFGNNLLRISINNENLFNKLMNSIL
ncbi:MAG: DUF1343 domain-containing protein [bacterium]